VELTLPVNYAIGIGQIVVQGRNEKRYVRAIAKGLNEIDGITVISERGKHLRDFELSIEIEFDMGDKETEESRTAKQSGQTLGTIGSVVGQLGGTTSLFGAVLGAAGAMKTSTAADKESTIMIVGVSAELLDLKDDSVLTEDVVFRKEVKKWTSNIEKKAYLKEAISEALRTTGRKIAYQVMDLEPPEVSTNNSQAVSDGSSGSSQSAQTGGTSSESGLFSLLKSSAAPADSGSSDRRGDGGTSQSFATAAPRMVTLIVRSNVENNRVFIDGEFAGSTRLDTKLPLGLHLVRVEKDGFNAFEESVNLQEALTLRVELVKIKEKTVIAAVPGAYTLTLVGFDKKAAIGLKRFLKGSDEVSKTKTVSITTAQRVYALFTDVGLDIVEELIVEGLMEVDVDIDSARIELSETEILVDITGETASVATTGSSSAAGTTLTVISSESQSASLTKSDESAADLQPEPQSDLKEAPGESTQNIAGLWIDDRSCHISIFENQADNLVGAAWGPHGGSMQIVLTPLIGNERRFDWKGQGRTMFEASLSDPKKTGRFTINTYDENKLHTSVNICSKKGSAGVPSFQRANSFSSYRVKPPRWYAASLQ
ncbi:MAG: PEGA domain-containing protein, partial [Planctomycetaceae bacterium]|nr:PEGA domain-containing protein [Planctomycetaceae bacterium]